LARNLPKVTVIVSVADIEQFVACPQLVIFDASLCQRIPLIGGFYVHHCGPQKRDQVIESVDSRETIAKC
jgi:hypothetical protein